MKKHRTIVLAIKYDRKSCLKEIMEALDRSHGKDDRAVAPLGGSSDPLQRGKSAFKVLNSMDIRVTGGRSARQLQEQMNAGAILIVLSGEQANDDLGDATIFEPIQVPSSDLSDKSLLQSGPALMELSGSVAEHRFDEPSAASAEEFGAKDVVLTTRELEILKFVAGGKKNSEIADMLGISVRTVEAHRASIMRKLNLHSIASLVRYAIDRHILTT